MVFGYATAVDDECLNFKHEFSRLDEFGSPRIKANRGRANGTPMEKHLVKASKFLSLVLRHRPEKIGLELDEQAWADVGELIEKASAGGRKLSLKTIREVVEKNDKKRFSFSDDGKKIRANQGHSVDVDLGLKPTEPPAILYHGTASRFLESILRSGLARGRRHDVHLSSDVRTAVKVGRRHGKPVVLAIDSGKMHKEGCKFYLSENKVWLTNHVPPEFIVLQNETECGEKK